MISVVADGSWYKRYYRFNYNALSGEVSVNNKLYYFILGILSNWKNYILRILLNFFFCS